VRRDPVNESREVTTTSKPDARLQQWLGYGAVSALITGALWGASATVSLAGWQAGGFDPSEVFDLAALLTLVVVLVAYWQLSVHVQTPELRKSACGLLGMLVLMELAALSLTEDDPHWWNIVIWVVLALAAALFIVIVWKLEEVEKAAADERAGPKPAETVPAEAVAPPQATDATAGTANQGAPPADGQTSPARRRGVLLGAAAVGLFLLLLCDLTPA
jgi:Ca2+/Na+ antiporter